MSAAIEAAIQWLMDVRAPKSAVGHYLVLRRYYAVLEDVTRLEAFVDLRVNASIQDYWHPVIRAWRERLAVAARRLSIEK